jgi:hypothetical protein
VQYSIIGDRSNASNALPFENIKISPPTSKPMIFMIFIIYALVFANYLEKVDFNVKPV